VLGNIFAKELIVLSECAVVHGDISAEAFTIASGAVIEGTMLQANRKVRDPQSAQLRSRLPA
jgi:cytoskeletal protein CcmA (bactofilin family)